MANQGAVASPILMLILSTTLCSSMAYAAPVFGVSDLGNGEPTPDDPSGRISRQVRQRHRSTENPDENQDALIPKNPSAPPLVAPKMPTDPFRCQRSFSFQGKVYGCDSNIRLDGEKLRDIIQDTPGAISELNLYQANRFKVRNAAYFASAGLLVAALGFLIHDCPDTSVAKNITTIGGLGLMVGSVAYAFGFIRNNESHLGNAVQNFNDAHPSQPIQLQFTTEINLK